MADQTILAIGNSTGSDARLISVVYPGDNCDLPAGVVTHTGGSDHNWIRVPDCSGSQWYADHHILLQASDGSWTVSFWSNDQQGGLLYWSPSDAYYDGNPLPNSQNNWSGTLLIQVINGNVTVGWAGW